jgi:NhaP-type Na+/H+ or K+/H+ antiporter
VGAFIGGLAFGSITPTTDEHPVSFTEDTGELLSLLVWFLFGAAMIVPAFDHLASQDVVFALLALTIVRMVPVAIALASTGVDHATVGFVGWFGPRGLASVVFALIAFYSLDPADANRLLPVVAATVVVSVIAHGITAGPLASRYGRHAAALHPQQVEHTTTPALRTRSIAGDRTRPRRTITDAN